MAFSDHDIHYLISCPLPSSSVAMDESIFDQQDAVVNRLMLEGRLVSYALSMESGQWWAICRAATDYELRLTLTEIPLHREEQAQIAALHTYASNDLGGFSLN